jgi:Tfp pilus assembly protein PilN
MKRICVCKSKRLNFDQEEHKNDQEHNELLAKELQQLKAQQEQEIKELKEQQQVSTSTVWCSYFS